MANTPIAGRMHLSPEGGTWDTRNSIRYTDLHPLLSPHPLFFIHYSKLSSQSATGYASTLLINSSMAYCIKVKAQILIWPAKTWISSTLPRFPASSVSHSLSTLQSQGHCASFSYSQKYSSLLCLDVRLFFFFSVQYLTHLPNFGNSHHVGQ